MKENMEYQNFEIPHSTLTAAQILGCDPQALMGLYDANFYKEIADNKFLESQMDDIFSILCNFLDTGNEEKKKKIMKAMEVDPLFKKFALDFIVENCVCEILAGSGFLSRETFDGAMDLIYADENLRKSLEDELSKAKEEENEYRESMIMIIARIKLYITLDNVLCSEEAKSLEPGTHVSKIHELVLRANKGSFSLDFTEEELADYKNHIENGPCSLCDLIKIKNFDSFDEFFTFMKEIREFKDMLNKYRNSGVNSAIQGGII